MNRYTKIINMMESYFTKDFEKTKKGFQRGLCGCLHGSGGDGQIQRG